MEIPGKRQSRVQYDKLMSTTHVIVVGAVKVAGLDICLLGDNNQRSTDLTASSCNVERARQQWRLTDTGN